MLTVSEIGAHLQELQKLDNGKYIFLTMEMGTLSALFVAELR